MTTTNTSKNYNLRINPQPTNPFVPGQSGIEKKQPVELFIKTFPNTVNKQETLDLQQQTISPQQQTLDLHKQIIKKLKYNFNLDNINKDKFNNIFENNYTSIKSLGTVNINSLDPTKISKLNIPSLLKGININIVGINKMSTPLSLVIDENHFINDNVSNDLKKILLVEIPNNTSQHEIYTKIFKKYIIIFNDVIKNKSYTKDLKLVMLGKLLTNFKCNNNNFKDRFKSFILDYSSILYYNKQILIEKIKSLVYNSSIKIGNCDWQRFDSLRIKSVESMFSNISSSNGPDISSSLSLLGNNVKTGVRRFLGKRTTTSQGNLKKIQDIDEENYNKLSNEQKNDIDKINLENIQKEKEELDKKNKEIEDNILIQEEKLSDEQKLINKNRRDQEETNNELERKTLKEIDNLTKSIRIKIMSLNVQCKNNFCSTFELVKTVEVKKDDPWWYRTPSLVAMTTASTNLITKVSLDSSNIGTTNLTNAISRSGDQIMAQHAVALATLTNAVLGPIIGLFIGLAIGTFLESEFFKNLRSSRLINLQFINYINSDKKLIVDLRNDNTSNCSYGVNKLDYIKRFNDVNIDIKKYEKEAKENYDDYIENLYFYLFIYDYICEKSHLLVDISQEGGVKKTKKRLQKRKTTTKRRYTKRKTITKRQYTKQKNTTKRRYIKRN